jgi:hypothetical protein
MIAMAIMMNMLPDDRSDGNDHNGLKDPIDRNDRNDRIDHKDGHDRNGS